jgi:hypothetical protein
MRVVRRCLRTAGRLILSVVVGVLVIVVLAVLIDVAVRVGIHLYLRQWNAAAGLLVILLLALGVVILIIRWAMGRSHQGVN